MIKFATIIVVYYPKQIKLDKSIDGNHFIVVDNTPQIYDNRIFNGVSNCTYIPLYKNLGIAKAQNIGILKAVELGCSYVVFLDQDSNISTDYIHSIVTEYIRIENIQNNLFLLGPTVINEKTKQEYKSIFHKDTYLNENFIQRREIISSGSCTSIAKIKKVGLLDDKLFIDFVDFEWCWRANRKNLVSGITPTIHLLHNVGQREIRFGKYKVIISSPFRYFYQYRNYLWLCRKNYVPIYWKIATGIKFLLRLLYFPIRLKEGWIIEKYIWKGIKAGISYGK